MILFDRVAAAVSASARCRHGLRLLERGEDTKGFRHLGLAASRGHTEAQHQVGVCYLEARGVPQSRADAALWLERAARAGHVEAHDVEPGLAHLVGRRAGAVAGRGPERAAPPAAGDDAHAPGSLGRGRRARRHRVGHAQLERVGAAVRVALDAEGEVDGRGVPTLTLNSRHDLTAEEKKMGKKRLAGATRVTADGQVRRIPWHEEWRSHERAHRFSYDP